MTNNIIPEARQLVQNTRALVKSDIIPKARQLVESTKSSLGNLITRPPATRVGNVGFRPRRFGGKISKFSK